MPRSTIPAKFTSPRSSWDVRLGNHLVVTRRDLEAVVLDVGPGLAWLTPQAAREVAARLVGLADETERYECPADPRAGHTIPNAPVCEISNSPAVPDGMLAVTVLVPDTYAPHIGLSTNTTLTIHPQEGN